MKKLLGYVGNTGVVTEEDAKRLTHINVAFGHLYTDGSIHVDHLNIHERMDQIRAWNPDIKILVSLVPLMPEHADAFTACAASPDLRKKAAQSCVEMVEKYHFDGVDFDWEYPCVPSNGMSSSPADKENFTLFCQEVRDALDALICTMWRAWSFPSLRRFWTTSA